MITIDIILICYKQEQYIEQALRSIYAQELPKDVKARIIVADDASPDDTLAIIKRLAPESPFSMMFLPQEPNMGISKNYKRSFTATTADYVFILEGDDYWLPNHITQHIDFIQSHAVCSMSMNEITFLHEDGVVTIGEIIRDPRAEYKMINLHKQIAEGNQLGNLSACMFRGQYLRELPETLYNMPIADWMIGVMLAQRGDIAIIKGSSSVYRVKASGVWAGYSRWQQHKIMLRDADMYDEFLNGEYHEEWAEFKHRCWQSVRKSWMHYMPLWIQKIWNNIKRK